VVLDPTRHQACSGSMDGTVRVWNLRTGACQHTLTGHTSLVGLLGLSPSYLVSAAADSTLRIWDPDTGKLKHTLAAHTGAITCFQHDEFKVLSGSDGNLKMWDIREGTVVRDLLTSITGVWQVVFEGQWCVAASNTGEATMLDVWDFGLEQDDEWIGEPPTGIYDDDWFSSDGDDDHEANLRIQRFASTSANPNAGPKEKQKEVDVEAMEQDDNGAAPCEYEIEIDLDGRMLEAVSGVDGSCELAEAAESMHMAMRDRSPGEASGSSSVAAGPFLKEWSEGLDASRWPSTQPTSSSASISRSTSTDSGSGGPVRGSPAGPLLNLPSHSNARFPLPRSVALNDETPTRPRIRGSNSRRR
jgi:F-box and WD-40 domain protein CDC4